MAWKLTWGAHEWTETDLLGQHAALLALTYKDESWTPLQVAPTDGPIALMAYLAAFIAVAEQRDCLEVQIELAALPLADLMGCVGADEPPPAPSLVGAPPKPPKGSPGKSKKVAA